MSQKSDGMNYTPQGKPRPAVKPVEFIFAAAYLDHGHINVMCNGLVEAGGQLKWVYDADTAKAEALAGLSTWGDGGMTILGTQGYMICATTWTSPAINPVTTSTSWTKKANTTSTSPARSANDSSAN